MSRTVEKRQSDSKTVEKSTYHVDNSVKTYGEVQTLLKAYGVDLDHKRFLILQGEVESIALMKPKGQNEHEDGLLEYLEDIIGTSSYKSQLVEAEKLLEAASDVREEKLAHMKLMQKETKSLEGQSKEAMIYIDGENKVTQLQNKSLQCTIKKLSSDLESATAEKAAIDEKIQSEQARHTEVTDNLAVLSEKVLRTKTELEVWVP